MILFEADSSVAFPRYLPSEGDVKRQISQARLCASLISMADVARAR